MYMSPNVWRNGRQTSRPSTRPPPASSARHAIQDVVGCMTAGAGDEGAAKVREAVDGLGDGRSVIAGRLAQTSSSYAALANGTGGACIGF